ncbi:MAG: hypothetical protein LJF04_03865 [Gemmatimonadetes bacterium]|nr:hypothetical protein [Gemmatimonadota bacterium]
MTMDERIRFLLRAATRAEGEGDERVARNFRRMAEDARPVDGDGALWAVPLHVRGRTE